MNEAHVRARFRYSINCSREKHWNPNLIAWAIMSSHSSATLRKHNLRENWKFSIEPNICPFRWNLVVLGRTQFLHLKQPQPAHSYIQNFISADQSAFLSVYHKWESLSNILHVLLPSYFLQMSRTRGQKYSDLLRRYFSHTTPHTWIVQWRAILRCLSNQNLPNITLHRFYLVSKALFFSSIFCGFAKDLLCIFRLFTVFPKNLIVWTLKLKALELTITFKTKHIQTHTSHTILYIIFIFIERDKIQTKRKIKMISDLSNSKLAESYI